jgi:hypothetical protein
VAEPILVVSERGVRKHVGNIFSKLGLAPSDADHRRVLAGSPLPGALTGDTAGTDLTSRCPLACARLRHCGGGLLAVAYLCRQLGDRRDLGYLERCSARDLGLGLGHIVIAEVRE